jgi:hypothetical protein
MVEGMQARAALYATIGYHDCCEALDGSIVTTIVPQVVPRRALYQSA